jgi:hypothetical protein
MQPVEKPLALNSTNLVEFKAILNSSNKPNTRQLSKCCCRRLKKKLSKSERVAFLTSLINIVPDFSLSAKTVSSAAIAIFLFANAAATSYFFRIDTRQVSFTFANRSFLSLYASAFISPRTAAKPLTSTVQSMCS